VEYIDTEADGKETKDGLAFPGDERHVIGFILPQIPPRIMLLNSLVILDCLGMGEPTVAALSDARKAVHEAFSTRAGSSTRDAALTGWRGGDSFEAPFPSPCLTPRPIMVFFGLVSSHF
jgi:hypothetical protein